MENTRKTPNFRCVSFLQSVLLRDVLEGIALLSRKPFDFVHLIFFFEKFSHCEVLAYDMLIYITLQHACYTPTCLFQFNIPLAGLILLTGN